MKADLRKNILSVAKALFMEKGFEAVGMREIAKAVGLQPTQVYRLELSKTDILAEVIIQLNDDLIAQLPGMLKAVKGDTAVDRTCAYLLALYQFDIHYKPLRSVGAIYGWSWNATYESAVVAQVMQFLAPVAGWMGEEGLDDIPARCYGLWSMYYVGYRRAVIHGGSAEDCLAEIAPTLKILMHSKAATSLQTPKGLP
jgi:AcrR family transcriptional regulator